MPTLIIGNKNYSSWSMRPWLALKKAGIDFAEVVIPLDQPDTKSRLLEVSGAGRVPVLRHGDLTIWESIAIIEYIAEIEPGLWPKERGARAYGRSIAAEMHAGFSTLRELMPMNCRAQNRCINSTPALANDITRVEQIWTKARHRFHDGGPWLLGQFSIADAMYAPVVSRFLTYGVTVDVSARNYMKQWQNDPQFADWHNQAAAETWSIPHEEVGM